MTNSCHTQDRALTILDHNHMHCIPGMINTLTEAEADAATGLSSLSQSVVGNKPIRGEYVEPHKLVLCSDEVRNDVRMGSKVVRKTRRKRGKCVECGNNTRWYCSTCLPGVRMQHVWCCPDETCFGNKRMCHAKHKKRCLRVDTGDNM